MTKVAAQKPSNKRDQPLITRRALCAGLGGTAVLLGLGGMRFVDNEALVRPPGGQDEVALASACIRCEKCYEVCPRGVIEPAHLEDGVLNMRTPVMTFNKNYCDWCTEENGGNPLCVASCPTEALKPGSTPTSGKLGLAVLNKDTCLAYDLAGCRFCYDACEYEAIELDAHNRPLVIGDRCNGCGACESVCVSMKSGSTSVDVSERAIIVRPL